MRRNGRMMRKLVLVGVLEQVLIQMGPTHRQKFFFVRSEDGQEVKIYLNGEGWTGPTMEALAGAVVCAVGCPKSGLSSPTLYADKLCEDRLD